MEERSRWEWMSTGMCFGSLGVFDELVGVEEQGGEGGGWVWCEWG